MLVRRVGLFEQKRLEKLNGYWDDDGLRDGQHLPRKAQAGKVDS